MNLKNYLKTKNKDGRIKFAADVGTTLGFLIQVAGGHRTCSETLALAIERESFGLVTVAELRPEFAHALQRSGYYKAESVHA